MFISATNFPSKSLPQIHQNPQQQKTHDLWKSRSRARGVAKTVFGIPMLHGKHFFFWSPCSVGMRFVTFATPPQRECDFFHFCRTSPARSSKIMKIASWSHAADVSARKMQKANRHQNRFFLRWMRSDIGTLFWHLQKFNEFMKNCAYSSRNIHNFTFGACMCSNEKIQKITHYVHYNQ